MQLPISATQQKPSQTCHQRSILSRAQPVKDQLIGPIMDVMLSLWRKHVGHDLNAVSIVLSQPAVQQDAVRTVGQQEGRIARCAP